MTFIPELLSTVDSNNSTTVLSGDSFTGISKSTTGYNSIHITIQSDVNSAAGGIQILFSNDNNTWITYYADTYIASAAFIKTYPVLKSYYKISYTALTNPNNITITSRLSTNNDATNSITTSGSVNAFDNSVENTYDAFGKLRVSNPQTLLELRFPGQSTGNSTFLSNNLQICNSSIGSYSATASDSKLIITGTGVGIYISQSRKYCVYQPGKSLLFLSSGIIDPSNSSFTARIGYFDDSNGTYFEYNNGISIGLRNNGVIAQLINQSNWNIDKMDGTGTSGINLDFSKTQLFVIDMEWLGVGRIRYGFYAFGRIRYCHQITNINALIEPYTNTINLPVRLELLSNSPGVTGTITQICSTVISEGGYTPIGKPFSISTNSTATSIATTEIPLLAIRGGGTNYTHQTIVPTNISVLTTSTNDILLYRLRLYQAPNSIGTVTWADVDISNSVTQYAINTSITGFTTANSIIVDSGYVSGKGSTNYDLGNTFTNRILEITSNINNVSDIIVLTGQLTSGSGSVYSTMSWQETY